MNPPSYPPLPPPYSASDHHYPLQYYDVVAAPPPPLPSVYSNAVPNQNINTLFVAGLPDDVKPREIHNLFRRRPGFDFFQLKYTGHGDQVVVFVTFFNHHAAMVAMNELDGSVFDPGTGATLHIELARSNSRKRLQGAGAYTVIDKREKVTKDENEASSNEGDDQSDAPSSTDSDSSSKKCASKKRSGKREVKVDKADSDSNEKSDVSCCSTLFIANLGPNCTAEELKQVLSQYPGFRILKMRGRRGMPVAFADFEDVESSTSALNGLQGAMLESSDRGGMHVEYAKSKMRKR